ncbi:hypothetical protein [Emergencia sp.]|uniref:hypothetical protein n=1 Tax=Emergencia sp. TaxID=1926557 RepID=UPI003AF19A96
MKDLKRKLAIFSICLSMILGGCMTVNANSSLDGHASTVAVAKGTITASDHWILPIIDDRPGNQYFYSGAAGYTTSSTYHRTSVEYLVCWNTEKVVRKWGTGKVQTTTGYVKPPYANLLNAFRSAVYYEF